MSSKRVGIVRAHCRDCGWDYRRSLEKKDFDVEENREIAQRVIRNHEFKCRFDEDGQSSWGEDLADVDRDLDMTGGSE